MSLKNQQQRHQQPWLKRVLIPFWVVQILLMSILIGVNAWVASSDYYDYSNNRQVTQKSSFPMPFHQHARVDTDYLPNTRSGILVMTFACVNITVIIIEIILFARRRLYPLTYLIFQVLKTTLWVVLFIMTVIGVARNARRAISSGPVITILLTGIIEVSLVL